MRFWNKTHEIHVLPLVDAEGSYYNLIPPESLQLLEPQIGDVLYTKAGGGVSIEVLLSKERTIHAGIIIKRGGRIIQRNGTPFMWPQSEVA